MSSEFPERKNSSIVPQDFNYLTQTDRERLDLESCLTSVTKGSRKTYKKKKQQLKIDPGDSSVKNIFYSWEVATLSMILLANLIAVFFILIKQNNKKLDLADKPSRDKESLVTKADLASEEFVDLDISNLSQITVTKDSSLELTSDSDTEQKKLTPLPIPPQNIKAFNSEYFYILAEYIGDYSLELARKKVNNISLIKLPQGTFIYLGAFKQKNLAQQFIEELQSDGLPGYIYPPD